MVNQLGLIAFDKYSSDQTDMEKATFVPDVKVTATTEVTLKMFQSQVKTKFKSHC